MINKKYIQNLAIEFGYDEDNQAFIRINPRPGFRIIKDQLQISFIDVETEGYLYVTNISSTGGWAKCVVNDKTTRIEVKDRNGKIIFSTIL